MAQRSRSPPTFAPRVFRAGIAGSRLDRSQPLPAFVAGCSSLARTARGEEEQVPAAAPRAAPGAALAACAALGARTLPGRPVLMRGAVQRRADQHAGARGPWPQQSPTRMPRPVLEDPFRDAHPLVDPALPGLRRGAPGRLASRPEPQSLHTEADRMQAMTDLTDDFYAASSGPAVRARRSCYARLLALWGWSRSRSPTTRSST